MARKSWCVYIDNSSLMRECTYYRGRYLNRMQDDRYKQLSLFYDKGYAEQYARDISALHPGIDVYIYESVFGFVAKPTSPAKKVWDKDGNYLPVKE